MPANDMSPRDRDIAMVFQSYALYPHLTVFRNLATPLELRKVPRAEIERRVAAAADLLDIAYLLNRKPRLLSGGQRQRVALARAIVRDPALFLLDEPLSNLDAQHRATLRSEIVAIHRRLGSTFVYVTHDQIEAAAIADRIAVMRAGHIEQVGSPQQLYDRPANTFVASFFGSPQMNMIPARLQNVGGAASVIVDSRPLLIPQFAASADDVILGLRPEHLSDEPLHGTRPTFEAVVTGWEPMGASIKIDARVGALELVVKLASRSRVRPGDRLPLWADLSQAHLFDPATGQALARDATVEREWLH
jgi:multiple sugar transport system ATP-binding protein